MATRRGDIAKQEISKAIIDALGDWYCATQDKKIYANVPEGGDTVQIAISLTMPKSTVAGDGKKDTLTTGDDDNVFAVAGTVPTDISESDRQKVNELKKRLGII